jgi:hypothetical protein
MNPREKRLRVELEKMLAIHKERGLIRFTCGDLTSEEAMAFLSPAYSADVLRRGWQQLLPPEEFMHKYPGRGPEKYLIQFDCVGLKRRDDGEIVETREHAMEVAFAHDYPAVPPRTIWLTPIWHPNITPPYFCGHGRPFAVGTSLDQLCILAGHMIQYKSYNVASYLNPEAAKWAEAHASQLPVDKRDLLGGNEHARPLVFFSTGDEAPPSGRPSDVGPRLVELL